MQGAGPHQPTQGWEAAPAKRQNSPADTGQAGHQRNLGLAWASLNTTAGHPKGGDARGDPWPGVPCHVQGDPQRGRPQNPGCAQRASSQFPGTTRSGRLGQHRRLRGGKWTAVRNQGKHERQRLRQPGTVLACVYQPPGSSLEPQGRHRSQVAALASHDLDAHPIGNWGTGRAERMRQVACSPRPQRLFIRTRLCAWSTDHLEREPSCGRRIRAPCDCGQGRRSPQGQYP